MKKKYKPTAWLYEDKDGVCAQHCRTKEIAQKVMQEIVDEEINNERDPDDEEFADPAIVITLEDIKPERGYGHRKCDGIMIGENICWDCGESCGRKGGKIWVVNF